MTRQINAEGLKIIKDSEGCRLVAYLCPAGIPTIGWGHTGPGIQEGIVWTQKQADDRLASDIEICCKAMENFTKGVHLTDNQFSALVCFSYNVGAWRSSTLMKHVLKGEFTGAAPEFDKWVHTGKAVLPGLVTRRKKERALFEATG